MRVKKARKNLGEMESDDAEVKKLCRKVIRYANGGDHNKWLVVLDNLLSAYREERDSWYYDIRQGDIFLELANKVKKTDMEVAL